MLEVERELAIQAHLALIGIEDASREVGDNELAPSSIMSAPGEHDEPRRQSFTFRRGRDRSGSECVERDFHAATFPDSLSQSRRRGLTANREQRTANYLKQTEHLPPILEQCPHFEQSVQKRQTSA
jgi:hypothetical protein